MSKEPQTSAAVEVFFSYSHKDKSLRDRLATQLKMLEREGVVSSWHDRQIGAGWEWAGEIDDHLKSADIILLLVSPDFIASDYCYDIELTLAMERHEAKEARVVPVILRPCDWANAPFGKLKALPEDGLPVTKWENRDEAFLDVAKGVRTTAEEIIAARPPVDAADNSRADAAKSQTPSLIPRPPVVGFVARRDEQGRDIVALLKEELAPEKAQLISLWGPGGTGKTTLAAEVVRANEKAFRGRVAWVSALGRTDFNLATLLDEIATQLGHANLRTLAPEPKAAQVAALVGAQPTLVVLDNFETISEEEQGRCLDFLALSAACPALITTRSFINRDDVYNVPLAAMTMEEARDLLQRLAARTRKPANFDRLDRDDLIQRCEANPLVLQWVVRQIDLAKRPQDVLNDLAQGEGDAAERVFTRSFNLPQVGDDGRDALLALSLFTPHASREALAEVAGFGDDLRRLGMAVEGLSALWLVETTEGNERLFLRGLTRELSKTRLSKDGRADDFRRRYVMHFLHHAEAHEEPTPEDLDALEAEKDNLLGAMDAAFGARDWESVMWIRSALNYFLDLRGYWDEAIRSGEQAEAAAREAKSDGNAAHFTSCVAKIRMRRGEYVEAGRAYQEALEIFTRLESERNVAVCLHQLALLAQDQGELDEARRLYGESLEIKKRLADQHGIAVTVWNLGNIALDQGDFDEAKKLLTESLNTFTLLKDQSNIAGVLNQLAILARCQSDFKEARRLYGESLDIEKKLGNQSGIAITLHELGRLAQDTGESDEARRLYDESLEIAKKLGNQSGIAITFGQLGLLAESGGNKVEAARLFREALSIFEKLRSPYADMARRCLERVKAGSD